MTKQETYQTLLPQIASLVAGETDTIANMAWQCAETIIVPNVHEFAGHIACSSASNSEIVVPILRDGQVIAVLDIDSKDFNTFDETDRLYLEQIATLVRDNSR